ncbi:ROK family protein [Paenibacillus sediminis]|uniref:fructokinase n=1 Tax=Paenibacillus sediminis TaxID=664909 RepID=A0ABS4H7X9_9BACL|nr:ROK family protein [Paenibacillus sediminis]MBP1938642.1 fructokinase [Paenibacillus sediminis]
MALLGAIEAGGTKFVCGVGTEDGTLLERVSFATTTPEKTMQHVVNFFRQTGVEAIGIGSFGPIDPIVNSPTYGFITTTPKLHWGHFDFVGSVKKHLSVPIGFDTDVNGAALGEYMWGAAQGLDSCLYMTVGTGIGAGVVVDGKLVHGLSHPEMGHIFVRRHPDDPFAGCCPYHVDCLEGVASGPAINQRWSVQGSELTEDHPAWELEAYYLAQALMNYILILSPHQIVMGGGVMKQKQLFPLIKAKVQEMINGYLQHSHINDQIDQYIVPPKLGDNAGLCGALALGHRALNKVDSITTY